MKNQISRADYLQLVGLATLAKSHYAQLNAIDTAASDILDLRKGDRARGDGIGEADGFVSDAMGDGNIRTMLQRLGVKVKGGVLR